MTGRVLVLMAQLLVAGSCWGPATAPAGKETSPTPPFQLPTATEVFNLRSRCEELGRKLFDENFPEQIPGYLLTRSHLSHYDPKTNRCYVEIQGSMADITKHERDSGRYLFDGQTGEMLAWILTHNDTQTCGSFKGDHREGDYACSDVLKQIISFMADDRKQ